ncbi:hypothetical protein [Streptomyces sp. NPDC054838]
MKLKRMAVVAAAAVVGPTVLMATPAMADEVENPAVTTPDAAPKDDSAAAGTPAPVTKPPAKETPAAQTPAPTAQTPAPVTLPGPEQPDMGDGDFFEHGTGPELGLNGVPGTFKAGGEWTDFTLAVDNSQGKAQESYVLVLAVAHQRAALEAGDARVQVRFAGQWHDVAIEDEGGVLVALLTDDLNIPKGAFGLEVRVKFGAGAPAGDIAIAAAGGSNADDGVFSDTVWTEAKIVKGGTGNGGGHDNGNVPKPNGGSNTTPIGDDSTHSGGAGTTGNTGTTGNGQTGGRLAETGTDAATTWALGAGGVALAMGAALVAGTGRRRRTTA